MKHSRKARSYCVAFMWADEYGAWGMGMVSRSRNAPITNLEQLLALRDEISEGLKGNPPVTILNWRRFEDPE